jgi:L-aminopeptidase/D-esterase-like protein
MSEMRFQVFNKTNVKVKMASILIGLLIAGGSVAAAKGYFQTMAFPTQNVSFNLPGLQVASLEDATHSTGATLFFFPKGADASYDVRGGSAATSETTLLDAGSYSNSIDGIAFAGGSTMGLSVGDGIREAIFKSHGTQASAFDSIPSVPTAVVYDYGSRGAVGADLLAYPDRLMGLELMKHLSDNTFVAGRAGAGVSTTANKISQKIWGGQGFVYKDLGYAKIVAAVVLNAMGNINVPGIKPISLSTLAPQGAKAGHNTTLSIIITDVELSRDDLKRLAMMVHTSMGRMIFPFHSYYDGDTHFSISTKQRKLVNAGSKDPFMDFSIQAADAMKEAIEMTVRTSNSQN